MHIKSSKILVTQRLILRHFTVNDVGALFELLKDDEVNVFLPWFPVMNIDEAHAFLLEHFLNEYDNGSCFRYAICFKEDSLPIGYIWVSNDESCDFGYALLKEHWHKGITVEASQAVLEQLKRAGYAYITATHDVLNPRSGEVMKKLGMEYKYTYVEQWQPKNIPVTFRMYQLNFDFQARTYMKYWHQYETRFIEDIE